jgi:hypothetical protein
MGTKIVQRALSFILAGAALFSGGKAAVAENYEPKVPQPTIGIEAASNSKFIEVDENFSFPQKIQESFQNPEKTIILIPDEFIYPTVNFNIGDAIPDASHGGVVSAIIRSDQKFQEDIEHGRVEVINLHVGEDPEKVLAMLNQIPANHKSQIILSFSIGTTDERKASAWIPVVDRIKQLSNNASGGDVHTFVAQGNEGVLKKGNLFAEMLHGMPNVTTVPSSYDILGRSGNRPLSPRSSIVGKLSEQKPYASTIIVESNGDINRDGKPDLGSAFTTDISKPSKQFGSQDAKTFVGMDADKVLASEAQSKALLQGEPAKAGVLYSLSDMQATKLLDAESLKTLTKHLPNPIYDEIFVDPKAIETFRSSYADWNEVVFFDRSKDNTVQIYNGKNGADFSIVHASTSFATPEAVLDFMHQNRER